MTIKKATRINKACKLSHPYSSMYKEVRAAWKKNPGVVTNMIQDMVEKKERLLERPFLLEFVERFLEIHREPLRNYDWELWDDVLRWTTRQKVQYIVDVYYWFRMQDYKHKYWATRDIHLNYLDKRTDVILRTLNIRVGNDKFQQNKIEIMRSLKKGDYPDAKKHDPFLIGRVLALLQYVEFLKTEKHKLLAPETNTTLKVPVELKKGNDSYSNQLSVSIPAGFFNFLQESGLEKEPVTTNTIITDNAGEQKLYTRIETAELMQISLPTLDLMTSQGKIKCHRIKGKKLKRYMWKDIQDALVEIESRYSRR